MSRLEKHYKKQVWFYSFLIITFVIIFSVFGLPFVLNSSSFLSQFIGKRDQSDRLNPLLQSIDLDNVPSATNSASIRISGNASNFDEIQFYVNDERVKKINLDNSGDFSEEITGLRKGENELFLLGQSSKGKKKTDKYRIVYRSEKPKLEITEPSDNSTTSQNEIKVVGKTESDINVRINNQPVVVDLAGNFQTLIKLNEGENKIKITVSDVAGNTEEKIITIKYEKD